MYRTDTEVSPQYKIRYWFLFLQVLRCFNSLGLLLLSQMIEVYSTGFPHSDISGSKVARHLPETFRSRATSFIVSSSQGIHRTPLDFLLRNLTTTLFVWHVKR
jgi:hypothetical protein